MYCWSWWRDGLNDAVWSVCSIRHLLVYIWSILKSGWLSETRQYDKTYSKSIISQIFNLNLLINLNLFHQSRQPTTSSTTESSVNPLAYPSHNVIWIYIIHPSSCFWSLRRYASSITLHQLTSIESRNSKIDKYFRDELEYKKLHTDALMYS